MDRENWILYPEARRKLRESGLEEQIAKAHSTGKVENDTSILGYRATEEIMEMQRGKFFDSIPKKERIAFYESLEKVFNERDSRYWSVKRREGAKLPVEPEDLLILSGFSMIGILRKREAFNYKKYGFTNIFEFTGTVGAAVQTTGKDSWPGLKWETERPDGTHFETVISGDMNADLRIVQKDLTAYETHDPLQNKIFYRPETNYDVKFVSAHHSTEGTLLALALKYIDQLDLKPDILSKNANVFVDWVNSLGSGQATTAQHYGGFDKPANMFFAGWEVDLPRLEENYKMDGTSPYCLTNYGFYIGPKNEFIIAYEGLGTQQDLISFVPEEMDNLIKSIFYQAAYNIGRTSLKQLTDILSYRFSDEFEKNQARLRQH